MKLELVRIADLNFASYNPDKRLRGKRMDKLAASIKRIGQIQPITIDGKNNVIDGHRRVTALKKCKQKLVWAIINDTTDNKVVYQEVNANSAKMSGNDNLGIWLKDRDAVTPRTDKQLANVEETVGREMLQLIYKSGMSISVYRLATHIVKSVGMDDSKLLKLIIMWLVKHGMVGRVKKSLEAGENPNTIIRAVRADRPIKMTMTVVD